MRNKKSKYVVLVNRVITDVKGDTQTKQMKLVFTGRLKRNKWGELITPETDTTRYGEVIQKIVSCTEL